MNISRVGAECGVPAANVPVVNVWPRPADVAVIHLPPGCWAEVHAPGTKGDGRQFGWQDDETPLVATVPGDRRLLGWGVTQCLYSSLRGIGNGRHKRDRAIWHEAADAVKDGGVVYVEHEQRDWYGRQVWVAVRVRPAMRGDARS